MLHTIAGLITYLVILVGIHLWPGQESSVCSCAYGGLALFYAVMVTLQIVWSLQDSRVAPGMLQHNDLRANMPWYASRKAIADLRSNLPTFSNDVAMRTR